MHECTDVQVFSFLLLFLGYVVLPIIHVVIFLKIVCCL